MKLTIIMLTMALAVGGCGRGSNWTKTNPDNQLAFVLSEALNKYRKENGGQLPPTLEALFPSYVEEEWRDKVFDLQRCNGKEGTQDVRLKSRIVYFGAPKTVDDSNAPIARIKCEGTNREILILQDLSAKRIFTQ